MKNIERQLQAARQNLLDLTMRNRLLNFRPTKARTIRVVDEIPREVYDILVLNEKLMGFLPSPKTQGNSQGGKEVQRGMFAESKGNDVSDLTQEEASRLWELPSHDATVADRHIDRFLQTPLESEGLQKRLFYIYQEARSILEELGYSTLYLAIGFLEWTESPDSIQLRQAPLILVPVELERTKVGSSFKLRWTGEDVSTNISLQAMLAQQGVSLPDFEMPEDKGGIDQYYRAVTKIISRKPKWRVVTDIYFGFFSFTKFIMYKDLDPDTWPDKMAPADHLLIQAILDPSNKKAVSDHGFKEEDVDQKLLSRDLYHVMDADPSQVAVIEDVKVGRDLVVEGPPGTGKSQTIANIIAEALAAGKNVLFVSEKMAALEVVKSRLDQVSLGDFCLELHSRKSNKMEVLKQLERTIQSHPPKSISLEREFDQLESLKSELNGYAKALCEPFGKLHRSPFDLFCLKEKVLSHFARVGRDMQNIKLLNVDKCDQKAFDSARSRLENLAHLIPMVRPLVGHAWRGCQPGIVLPPDEKEIHGLIDECRKTLVHLKGLTEGLAHSCAIKMPISLKDLPPARKAAMVMAESKPTDRHVLLNVEWNKPSREANELIRKVEEFQQQRSKILSKFQEKALHEDVASWLEEYEALLTKCLVPPDYKRPLYSKMLPPAEEDISSLIVGCRGATRNLETTINQLVDTCGIRCSRTLKDLPSARAAAMVMAESKPTDRHILLNVEWNKPSREANELIRKVEEFQQQLSKILSKFQEKALHEDVASCLVEYRALSAKWSLFRLLNSRYRYLTQKISDLYKNQAPKESKTIGADLKDLEECLRLRRELREVGHTGQELFGSLWMGDQSDSQSLRAFAEWIVSFRQLLLQGTLTENALDIVSTGISKEQVTEMISHAHQAEKHFVEQLDLLPNRIGFNYEESFGTSANEVPFSDLASRLELWTTGLPKLQRLTEKINDLYKSQPPRESKRIIADLNELVDCLKLREELRKSESIAKPLFGSHWRADQSDPNLLQTFAEWIVSFRRLLSQGALTENALDIASTGISKEQVTEMISQAAQAEKQFLKQLDRLANRIGFNYEEIFGASAKEVPFSDLASRLELWTTGLPKLQRWAQFIDLRDDCIKTVAKPVVKLIEEDEFEPEDIVPCFEGNFVDNLLSLIFREKSILAKFAAAPHENKIHAFAVLDEKIIEKNRQRLAFKLYQSRPQISGGASPGSEAGILQGEFNRKRGRMPIRKLMSQAGGLIRKLKPCFMMSPLSIAQFLDPQFARFDLIVFDEASQVRPEDALGALLRGNQVVVMGDTHQLPPTTFFDRMMEDSDEDEQDMPMLIADVESILHQCRRCFPTKILRWHYRSRHESLIAVSNQEFYDNRLLVYPSPVGISEHLGLKFVHLPDTVYDRGRSQVNRKEARVVAEAALEHYREFADKSLGIGAFNIKQQEAIQEEIELQLRLHPEMEGYFKSDRNEHFFVKNLETIQGDERDVIFLSIGFGRDSVGRMTLNFGPLNQVGGERRLNVLITRARERCVVFSNFRASDLSLDAGSPVGLRALKVFLGYAENRNLQTIEATAEDTESPFEDSVYDFVRSCGYEVRKQIGCAGFRVDLAVVNPQSPGSYLLGIECDGAKYHTSPVARDRDRLREQILRNLGWRIHRIWSTDWYRNRSESEQRLLNAIEQARNEPLVFTSPSSTNSLPKKTVLTQDNVRNDDNSESGGFEHRASNSNLLSSVPDYEVCSSLGFSPSGELHECPTEELASAVTHIVDVEGPIHFDEVVRRMRFLWGLKRAGQRINDAISGAVVVAEQKKEILMVS